MGLVMMKKGRRERKKEEKRDTANKKFKKKKKVKTTYKFLIYVCDLYVPLQEKTVSFEPLRIELKKKNNI